MIKQKNVKILKSQLYEYGIFQDQVLGKGAFGKVYKGIDMKTKQQLAIKVANLKQIKKKNALQTQINILASLPYSPYLVNIKPILVQSQNNLYMIMEYCNNGNLQKLIHKQQTIDQKKFSNIFYQLISGYKILYKSKILHQDIKPDNIMIHNDKYKLGDFGLSIFYQNHQFGNQRMGTFIYMAPQKFQPNYKGHPKSDIYALGIIFYRLLVKKHPYVRKSISNYKEYLNCIKEVQPINPNLIYEYQLKFSSLVDLIMRMIHKQQKYRIQFQQIITFIDQSKLFSQFKKLKFQKENEQKIYQVINKLNLNIINVSLINITKIKQQQQNQYCLYNQQLITQMKQFLSQKRSFIFFFDRLIRRLQIQAIQKQKQLTKNQFILLMKIQKICLLISNLLLNIINNKVDTKYSQTNWKQFIKSKYGSIFYQTFKKDYQYLLQNFCQLKERFQQRYGVYELDKITKTQNIFINISSLQPLIIQILKQKATQIKENQRQHLITLEYLLTCFQFSKMKWQNDKAVKMNLQNQHKLIEMKKTQELEKNILQKLQQLNISIYIQLIN